MVGGARVFGPKPRDYWFKLNKKVKALARKSALSYKAQANNIIVVEDFTFEAPKTKDFVNVVYNVTVVSVNTVRYAGKNKSRYTKSGLIKGRTNAYKKAFVTLKAGDTIDFYSNI